MQGDSTGDVTQLLSAATGGDAGAVEEVADLVYAELRGLARGVLRHQSQHQTYRTTALVNEAFVRLVGQRAVAWESRAHFLGVAAKAMRSILIDYARARGAQKRGGAWERVPLDDVLGSLEQGRIDAIDLDDALRRLEALDERKCRVVELRFFAGLSIEETAEVLGVGHGTVERDWQFTRLWLYERLSAGRMDQ